MQQAPRYKRRIAKDHLRVAPKDRPDQGREKRQHRVATKCHPADQPLPDRRERNAGERRTAEILDRKQRVLPSQGVLHRDDGGAVEEAGRGKCHRRSLLAPAGATPPLPGQRQRQQREEVKPGILSRAEAKNEKDQRDAEPPQHQRDQKHHAGADEKHHEMGKPCDGERQAVEGKEQRQGRGGQNHRRPRHAISRNQQPEDRDRRQGMGNPDIRGVELDPRQRHQAAQG